MSLFITPAQPPLAFIPPALDLKIVRLTQWLLPLWMRSKTSLTEVQAHNLEELVRVYQQFEQRQVRVRAPYLEGH